MADLNIKTYPLGTANVHLGPAAPGGTDVVREGRTYMDVATELVELEIMYEQGLPNRAATTALVEPEFITRTAAAEYLDTESPLSTKMSKINTKIKGMGKGLDSVLKQIVKLK
ncbi:MAG: hypothetical protein JW791_05430 [Nanoarchaeota archaeon]|nr:hypothetical protein [Nanoarchaeota archaeon]